MNPARELHTLLSKWATVPARSSIQKVRSDSAKAVGTTMIVEQSRAARLVNEVETALHDLSDAGEAVESFASFFESWWIATILPNEVWNASVSNDKEVIPHQTLATLDTFALFLDKSLLQPIRLDPRHIQVTRDALAEVVELIGDNDDFDDGVRNYVFRLATELRSVFDSNTARVDEDVLSRVMELRGWLEQFADRLEKDAGNSEKVTVFRRISRALAPVAKNGLWVATGALASSADVATIIGEITP